MSKTFCVKRECTYNEARLVAGLYLKTWCLVFKAWFLGLPCGSLPSLVMTDSRFGGGRSCIKGSSLLRLNN